MVGSWHHNPPLGGFKLHFYHRKALIFALFGFHLELFGLAFCLKPLLLERIKYGVAHLLLQSEELASVANGGSPGRVEPSQMRAEF